MPRTHDRFRLLLAFALGLSAPGLSPGAAAASRVFAACTDFSSGCGAWADVSAGSAVPCVESISSDPVARWAFDRVYVVNRFGFDNVQVLDPANGFQTVRQFSVGNGTNPQDIAVLSPSKAYVSRLSSTDLLIVNPETGASLGAISLAAFADADGFPEAHAMLLLGDRLFVSLQRLDNFVPSDSAFVAVIDVRADTLLDADPVRPGKQAIRLTGTNPNTDLVYDATGGLVLVGATGAFGALDGGVERIDPVALVSLGFEATEAQLGGDVNDVAVSAEGAGYAVVNDASFDARLVRYERGSGAPTDTLLDPGGFSIGDIEIAESGELLVCDRSFAAPGLRIYRTANDSLLAGPLDTGLPPFDLAVPEIPPVAGIGPSSPAGGLAFLGASPNPSGGAVRLRFRVEEGFGASVRVRVFDARGAEVEGARLLGLSAGAHEWSWAPAARLPGGVYFVRLTSREASASGRFVRLP